MNKYFRKSDKSKKNQLFIPYALFILLNILCYHSAEAQSGTRQIEIINSDQLSFDNQSSDAKKLIGNVILKHDNAFMYCDSAYLYDAENKFEAFSNVRINQGDSLNLTGNHLLYEGKSKMAHVDGNVHLNQKGMTLTTDRLDYDMNRKIANYSQKAKIVNGSNILYSQLGQYFSDNRELLFKKDVLLINPKYTMYTDTMKFNTSSEIAYFYGPTTIITKQKDTLYCENGWYNTKKDFAQFSKNASIISGSQQLKS
ncbi:MAG: hypothetical protein HYZ42_03905, partial [Bacteroidetes bacterium]|nr:hypothetical protein [Bacteroidota bacterium]